MRRLDGIPPWAFLLATASFALISVLVAVQLVLDTPWLGLDLRTSPQGHWLEVVHARGPTLGIPTGARLVAVAPTGAGAQEHSTEPILLQPLDLTEEPDLLTQYDDVRRMMARQTAIHTLLREASIDHPLRLMLFGPRTQLSYVVEVVPETRPLTRLPPGFWMMQLYGLCALLLGAWVWVLRPRDWGARAFGVTGIMLFVATGSAAIYGSRELAIDGDWFRMLTTLSHGASTLFGCAIILLFMSFPRMLKPASWFWVPFAVCVPWWMLDSLYLLPAPLRGISLLLASQMLVAFVLAFIQWLHARGNPVERTALRWITITTLAGCALFVLARILPDFFGLPPISQSIAFAFFMPVYAGLAIGVRQYRLFALDEWAFRILLYIAGALTLLILDMVFLLVLRLNPEVSLSLALVITGFAYLPLRNVLWRRMVDRWPLDQGQLFQAVLDVTLAPTPRQQLLRWRALLQTVFQPLQIRSIDPPRAPETPEIRDQGLTLALPGSQWQPPLLLISPWQGRGLFRPMHVRRAQELMALLRSTQARRDDFERGAAHERRRIAQDLHDDVGALLLGSLYLTDLDEIRQTLRNTIAEIRTIVSGLAGDQYTLEEAIAEVRHETGERLTAAGLVLHWDQEEVPEATLEYRCVKSLFSAVRETVTNTLRHARASTVQVFLRFDEGMLKIELIDDGQGALSHAGRRGRGLDNIRKRMRDIGGDATIRVQPAGTVTRLRFPVGELP